MAYYRQIYTTFWTDSKIADDFTPEDKYFYLYLLTNSYTNLCGCYEISRKQISNDTGYTIDVVDKLLDRLENTHEIIKYSTSNKEVLIMNWYKYNWSKSDKLLRGVANEAAKVKTSTYRKYILGLLDSLGYPIDTLSSADGYPMHTSVTVTDTVSNTVSDSSSVSNSNTNIQNERILDRTEIIKYLNEKTGKHYKYDSTSTIKLIDRQLNDGFTVGDFKKVIDNKCYEWIGTDREQFLRPETLFIPLHFESYLYQKKVRSDRDEIRDDAFWDSLAKGE